MLGLLFLDDLESLEAMTRDEDARRLFVRIATLSQAGRLEPFLDELRDDRELDAETKGTIAEIARDPAFLAAVDDYVRSTQIFH